MPAVETFYDVIRRQGITRRSFSKFCSLTAASLGLGPSAASAMEEALATKERVPVIWMHGSSVGELLLLRRDGTCVHRPPSGDAPGDEQRRAEHTREQISIRRRTSHRGPHG